MTVLSTSCDNHATQITGTITMFHPDWISILVGLFSDAVTGPRPLSRRD